MYGYAVLGSLSSAELSYASHKTLSAIVVAAGVRCWLRCSLALASYFAIGDPLALVRAVGLLFGERIASVCWCTCGASFWSIAKPGGSYSVVLTSFLVNWGYVVLGIAATCTSSTHRFGGRRTGTSKANLMEATFREAANARALMPPRAASETGIACFDK